MAETELKYYVYDSTVKEELATHKVRSDANGAYVKMTPTQAKYWLDQGVIGQKPISAMSSTKQGTMSQLVGGKLAGYVVSAAEPAVVGADYDVDDTLTLANGVVLTVATVDGSGGITGLTVTVPGFVNTPPTNPVTPSSTSGSGTNATVTLTWLPSNAPDA